MTRRCRQGDLTPIAAAAAVFLAILFAAVPAAAKAFGWSSQGDFLTADPHAQNEGINNLLGYHVYERLTTRDRELRLIPSLATSWEQVNATTWRFRLRKGVKFHDGTPFTADDVVFSIERAQLPSSNFKTFANAIGKARRIDDHTVEIVAPGPDYKLYLSPEFVETEADFARLKPRMARVGDVRTFENFVVAVPETVDVAAYTSAIVWCESFGQFITATKYR